jgi:hypothetical protein
MARGVIGKKSSPAYLLRAPERRSRFEKTDKGGREGCNIPPLNFYFPKFLASPFFSPNE